MPLVVPAVVLVVLVVPLVVAEVVPLVVAEVVDVVVPLVVPEVVELVVLLGVVGVSFFEQDKKRRLPLSSNAADIDKIFFMILK